MVGSVTHLPSKSIHSMAKSKKNRMNVCSAAWLGFREGVVKALGLLERVSRFLGPGPLSAAQHSLFGLNFFLDAFLPPPGLKQLQSVCRSSSSGLRLTFSSIGSGF